MNIVHHLISLLLLFAINCNNFAIDGNESYSYKEGKDRVKLVALLYAKNIGEEAFLFDFIGFDSKVEDLPCREIRYEKRSFDNCLATIILELNKNEDKPNTSLAALMIIENFCDIKKLYFLDNSNTEGEIQMCKIKK